MKVFTLGYEGLDLADFLTLLRTNAIEEIADVRELPLSRKRSFSKTALAAALQGEGIGYRHYPRLGPPRELRRRYQAGLDRETFARHFLLHLEAHAADLADLARRVSQTTCCLLCFEADAARCHRWFLADQLTAMFGSELEVEHL